MDRTRYFCLRCGVEGFGGFNPTIFCFNEHPKINNLHMCRSCYEAYWKAHMEFLENFLEQCKKIEKNEEKSEV